MPLHPVPRPITQFTQSPEKLIFTEASKKSDLYLKACEAEYIRGSSHMAQIKNLPSTEKKTLLIKRFLINSASLIRREFIPHQYFTMSAKKGCLGHKITGSTASSLAALSPTSTDEHMSTVKVSAHTHTHT